MSIQDDIQFLKKEQRKQHKTKAQVIQLMKDLNNVSLDDLSKVESFDGHINMLTNDVIRGKRMVKVHLTTLFMFTPNNFDYLLKNNPAYKKSLVRHFKNENEYYHPINFSQIGKQSKTLIPILIDNKISFNYSLYADVDDVSSVNKLWKTVKINHLEYLSENYGRNYQLSEKRKSSIDLSFIISDDYKNKTNKIFSEALGDLIDTEISKNFQTEENFNVNIKKFISSMNLFKELAGDGQIMVLKKSDLAIQYIENKSIQEFIDERIYNNNPNVYENYIAINKKNAIAKNMDNVMRKLEKKGLPVIEPEDNGYQFKM